METSIPPVRRSGTISTKVEKPRGSLPSPLPSPTKSPTASTLTQSPVILQQADTYHLTWAASGLDCTVIAAEINGLTPGGHRHRQQRQRRGHVQPGLYPIGVRRREDLLQTGLASESTDLRYDEARAAYACDGQRFLLLHYQDNGQQDATWTPICTATQETLAQFATEEMLQKYGSEYTAAAMELYTQYLEANQQ